MQHEHLPQNTSQAHTRLGTTLLRIVQSPVFADTIAVLCITLFFTLGTGETLSPGLIFPYSSQQPLYDLSSNSASYWLWWNWLLAIPVCVRRVRPAQSAIAFIILALVQLVFGPTLVFSDFYALVLIYTITVRVSKNQLIPLIIAAYGMAVITTAVLTLSNAVGPLAVPRSVRINMHSYSCLPDTEQVNVSSCVRDVFDMSLFGVMLILLITATIIVALWHRSRRATALLLQEQTATLAANIQQQAQVARLAERARIARDMHDVVAHTLSIIIVQADAGRIAGAHNLAVAMQTMQTIVTQSRQALDGMHQLLGTLDSDTQSQSEQSKERQATPAPANNDQSSQPDYTHIYQLVVQAQHASPESTFTRTITGTPEPYELSILTSTTAYRIVQEALSNIRKHAGPHVHVTIEERWSLNQLELTITDNGRGITSEHASSSTSGYGLLGMKERVQAAGGTLSANPLPQGGFQVHAILPFHATSSIAQTRETQSAENQPAQTNPLITVQEQVQQAERKLPTVMQSMLQAFRHERRHLAHPMTMKDKHTNIIARLSSWTSTHYLVMDTLLTCMLIAFNIFSIIAAAPMNNLSSGFNIVLSTIETLPLALRRRMPQLSAALMGSMAVLHCLVFAFWPYTAFIIVIALYSVMLYGPKTAKAWVYPLTAIGCFVASLHFTALSMNLQYGIVSVLYILFSHDARSIQNDGGYANMVLILIASCIASLLICIIAIATGLIRQSRNTNIWVLQAQQQALLESQQQRLTLAANTERNRIAAQIQQEVTDTLHAVIAQSELGLAQLTALQQAQVEQHIEPDSNQISQLFIDIASLGRSALARMRALLRVLRDTSDTDINVPTDHAPLRPITG